MVRQKKHIKRKGRRKSKPEHSKAPGVKFINGRITATPSGYGFVKPDEGGADIFIPPQYMGDAMDGDLVRVEPLPPRRGKEALGPAGAVRRILERARNKIVGELIAGRKIRPLSKRLPESIVLEGNVGDAKRGDWVETELAPSDAEHGWEPRVRFCGRLGKAGTVSADLDAVMEEYRLAPPYTEQQEAAALASESLLCNREDLRQLTCLTIDPADAKDYDDAVSISPGEKSGQVVLGVHIADVAAWVAVDSPFDAEAAERAFTAYLPGRTLPMLPKGLTKRISLNPDVDNFAHTVMIAIDSASGKVISSRRCRSLIRITARLNFDEVQAFIDEDNPPELDAGVAAAIREIIKLTRVMREERERSEQFLNLATEEIRVICDDNTEEITGIQRRWQRESDQLVEECMLAANVEVAKELLARQIPGIFRIHDEPDPEKLLEFSIFLEETFGLISGDLSSRAAINNFLSSLPDDQRKPVITDAFLRSLPRAQYKDKHGLHFGLGKGIYGHFTSPIRRYPDLLVHQQLWAADQTDGAAVNPGQGRQRGRDECAAIAASCSEKEIINDEAWFAANDRLKMHYMRQHIADPEKGFYEAVIRKLSKAGLLIDIPDLNVTGFVPVNHLGGSFRKRGGVLSSVQGHREYRVGNFIFVRLEQADTVRGQAIFRPVD